MENASAWKRYAPEDLEQMEALADGYKAFISTCKTERECCSFIVRAAEEAGYRPLEAAIASGEALQAGAKLWAANRGKAVMLIQIGEVPIECGLSILGAHIDSPRLDVKQNPLYEKDGLTLLDTHYYGGIKSYQWVSIPLALHGVVAKKDGTVLDVCIGEDADDPVFCVTDLLPHLGRKQLEKKASEVIDGEALDILVGNRLAASSAAEGEGTTCSDAALGASEAAAEGATKDTVKEHTLRLLKDIYDLDEEDLLSAELEVVPAGPARDLGFDRSMVLGYGQDDRVCAYTSLEAQLALKDEPLKRTAVCILVDKEEIGSVGATGMDSLFFENTIAEVMELAGEGGMLPLRRALAASEMLSSDVSAGVDPAYGEVFESKNSAFMGRGLVFNKYTGAHGKSGSNDARAEFMARIRHLMDDAGVTFQTAELGKVDAGGGGTIAFIPARYGMDVIDSGVPVLSMHSPWEVTSKADIFEARKGYEAFLRG